MVTSEKGIALIKHFEGFSPKAYLCPAGLPTIGYGHQILPKEKFGTLTEAGATFLLKKDLVIAEDAIEKFITVPLTQGQFDALVSFVFNLGAGVLQRSTLRRFLNKRDYAGAAQEFLRWVWADGVKLEGLKRRREAEKALFEEV